MSSITDAMRGMPPSEQLAYKQGVEAGVEFILAQVVMVFDDIPAVVMWALDARARFKEHAT